MRAFILEGYSRPFREVEMPRPSPGPGQVLVRMAAAGINHADERSRRGEFKLLFHPNLPSVAGGELSGEVVAVGEGVSRLAVGDAVIAYTGVVEMGAFAEFAVVKESAVSLAPVSVPPGLAVDTPRDVQRRGEEGQDAVDGVLAALLGDR